MPSRANVLFLLVNLCACGRVFVCVHPLCGTICYSFIKSLTFSQESKWIFKTIEGKALFLKNIGNCIEISCLLNEKAVCMPCPVWCGQQEISMCAEKLGKTHSFRLCYSTALAYSQNARELRDQNTEFFRQAERHLVVTPTKNKRLSMSNIKRLTEENEGQILLVTLRFGWFTTNRKSTMRANKRFNCLRNT